MFVYNYNGYTPPDALLICLNLGILMVLVMFGNFFYAVMEREKDLNFRIVELIAATSAVLVVFVEEFHTWDAK